jgi:hypothetical protein
VSHGRPWGTWITWFGFACVALARVGAKTPSQAAFDAVLALLLLVLAIVLTVRRRRIEDRRRDS